MPPGEETVYLSVVARLDDGSQAEDVRFLRAPEYVEEIEVDLVELYVTVTGRGDELVRGLSVEEFAVLEAGEPQEITKFELVENLPLTVGLVLDTSGSMSSSLSEAEKAAADFLESVIRPGDRSFAMTFAGRPVLRMPLTDDVEAVGRALKGLQAVGATSLHDAVLHALQTFRGVRGQRALVLLSDGDDTSSSSSFDNALEYARRSGVAIFAVGLDIPRTSVGVRSKLSALAADTGGEVFFVGRAEQLQGVYERIELELRSRYLLAFQAQRAAGQQGFRPIEVRVLRKGLKARTARGYYP